MSNNNVATTFAMLINLACIQNYRVLKRCLLTLLLEQFFYSWEHFLYEFWPHQSGLFPVPSLSLPPYFVTLSFGSYTHPSH